MCIFIILFIVIMNHDLMHFCKIFNILGSFINFIVSTCNIIYICRGQYEKYRHIDRWVNSIKFLSKGIQVNYLCYAKFRKHKREKKNSCCERLFRYSFYGDIHLVPSELSQIISYHNDLILFKKIIWES